MSKIKTINKLLNNEVILIYQQGKVASRSIAASIEKSSNLNTLKKHSFYNHITKSLFKNYKSTDYYLKQVVNNFKKIKTKIILELLKRNEKLKIITLVREPISRNISFYFQDFQIPLMDLNCHNDNTKVKNTNLDKLISDFYKNFNHFQGVNWFDNEIKRSFNIDVFDYRFNKDGGVSIIEDKNLQIMIIKLEKIKKVESNIGDFLGVNNFQLLKKNMSQKKWYNGIYNKFKSEILINNEYINELYDSKYMKHFYSENEINLFKEKYMS